MRTQQGKSLKRGRKPGKNKKNKKNTKKSAAKHTSKAKDRLNIMKAAKEKSPSKRKAKSADEVGEGAVDEKPSKSAKKVQKVDVPEVTKAAPKAVPKSKTKAMKRPAAAGYGDSSGVSKRSVVGVKGHQQERAGTGKGWVYRVLPNQTFGCRSCRFIFNGCHHCQKENFRGFSAASMREQQAADDKAAAHERVEEEAEGSHAEVAGGNIKRKNGKKVKKGNKAKKGNKVKKAKVSK